MESKQIVQYGDSKLSPAFRGYLYQIAVAAIPILVVSGLFTSEEATLYLNLAAALLGLGTVGVAALNRPVQDDQVVTDEEIA